MLTGEGAKARKSLRAVALRDGRVVPFQIKKIEDAMRKAFVAVMNGDRVESLDQRLHVLAKEAKGILEREVSPEGVVNLERIQDAVEKVLMQQGYHAVAREYVIYREKRAQERKLLRGSESTVAGMRVRKRDGRIQPLSFDKIIGRVRNQAKNLQINLNSIIKKTVAGLHSEIDTCQIDNYLAEVTSSLVVEHPDYAVLAGRIKATALQKDTDGFADATEKLRAIGLLNDHYYEKVRQNLPAIEEMIRYERDYQYDYFALATMIKAYLLHADGKTVERPQDMWMRVAITVSGEKFDVAKVKETYDLMSKGYYTHATPTLFNSGLRLQQLSSCYLLAMEDDSISGIFNTLKDCAQISKIAGGIGVHAHNIRAAGSLIKTTNGRSNGLIPFLKIYNETARSVDQGGGKRKGSFAIYLEPWHADIESFLELRKNVGAEEFRARDLFYALWVPDLFMQRVENHEMWTLMSEDECPGLSDVYGEEFEKLYTRYESEGRGRKQISARALMTKIAAVQIETGQPYMLYKDTINCRSNQKNLGTIKSSNLCAEIVEYSDANETAVCNLASLSLPSFVKKDLTFDFDMLQRVTKVAIANLDRVIDANYYPTEKAQRSNLKHRPIGLGVQGLADVFFKMHLPYASLEAKSLDRSIFEAIYFAALEASCELAKEKGPYSSYQGSPISKGELQFNHWGVEPSFLHDWQGLRKKISQYGVRNSLLTACMPTASTAILLCNTESIQAQTSNIYKRQTLSGEFIIVNRYLVEDLMKLGLWNSEMRDRILLGSGSIQSIAEIPDQLKKIYLTVWEISQREVIDMAAARGPFIDQSQSMNLWLAQPTTGKVSSMHMYSWRKGLKTGMYYLRTRPASDAFQVTVSSEKVTEQTTDGCAINENEDCIMCSS